MKDQGLLLKIVLAFELFLGLIHNQAHAQISSAPAVNISINITPPYSPYYSDYSGINASKVLLVVQNLSANQIKIKLAGKLEGDNGVKITTYTNYVPLQPIVLNPHETRQLNGYALRDIFDINNLSVSGVDKARLASSSRIPEGNYTFCIEALDYNTRKLLSAQAPLGCTTINISYPEPPILINPVQDAKIYAQTPQTIIFNWTNAGTVPFGTQYTIQVAEMPDVPKDPNQILNATSFPILSQTVSGFSYVYNLMNVPLKVGKKYAWRVIASDPSNRTVFKNNGVSGAAVFSYGQPPPSNFQVSSKSRQVLITTGRAISIFGALWYQYHSTLTKGSLPTNFNGVKDDTIRLSNQKIQLCYGLCYVKMDLTKHPVRDVVKPKPVLISAKVFIEKKKPEPGREIDYKGMNEVDSIPHTGKPAYNSSIRPAGLYSSGLGEVIANTITDSSGNYHFQTVTNRACKIVEAGRDGIALVYCYYINIVDKHFSDPADYIYDRNDTTSLGLNVGIKHVFMENFNLSVTIDRNKELSTTKGKSQNYSIENANDSLATVYILRTRKLEGTFGAIKSGILSHEGDNSGHVALLTSKEPAFLKLEPYDVVAKSQVSAFNDHSNSFSGTVKFYNLLFSESNAEKYTIYAEYKNAGITIEPQDYSHFSSIDFPDYNPELNIVPENQNVKLTPSFVSLTVKGIMKYRFRDGPSSPLAKVSVSLRVLNMTAQKDSQGKNIFDTQDDGSSQVFATVTTDANGNFTLNSGDINYDSYSAVGGALFFKRSIFITVNSPYYGSPDMQFNLQAGNTYNIGEQIAQVRDFTLQPQIVGVGQGKLPGQKVYVLRMTQANPQSWGVPIDEGTKATAPLKQIQDINQTQYDVVGYGISNSEGKVTFKNLVMPDLVNSNDQYYVYTESDNLSTTNYSSQYAEPAVLTFFQQAYSNNYTTSPYMFNSALYRIDNVQMSVSSYAQKPYIEGGVYPESNSSTNALSGVQVNMYDVNASSKTFAASDFMESINTLGVDDASILTQSAGYMSLQSTETTGSDARFRFDDPTAGATKNGWKLLTYSKPGFISGYSIINGGAPMKNGSKETVKGFLLPPETLHVFVRDQDSGQPIAANIVVGSNFSWASQMVNDNPYSPHHGESTGATLTSTFGKVTFTIIPEDNVKYASKKFRRTIVKQSAVQNISDFVLESKRNRFSVCLVDAVSKKAVAGLIAITDLPPGIASQVPPKLALPNHCVPLSFSATQPSFNLVVTAPGYATYTQTLPNNTEDTIPADVFVQLQPGITVQGTVTQDDLPAAHARVYVKELPELGEVQTDSKGFYKISGLPANGQLVTVQAVSDDKDVIGQGLPISLNLDNFHDVNSATVKPGAVQVKGQNITGGVLGKQTNVNASKMPNQMGTSLPANTHEIDFGLHSYKGLDLTNLYGFGLEVESLSPAMDRNHVAAKDGSLVMTGRVKILSNSVFQVKQGTYLHFTNVNIHAGNNHDPIKIFGDRLIFDDNKLSVQCFNNFSATLGAFKGITLFTDGVIGGTVAMNGKSLPGNISLTSEVTLMPLQKKPVVAAPPSDPTYNHQSPYAAFDWPIPAFYAGKNTEANTLANYYSYACSDGVGDPYQGLHYELNNLYYASAGGYVAHDGLHLTTIIHTSIDKIAQQDLMLNIGEVLVDNAVHTIAGTTPISLALDNWSIKSKDWHIGSGTLKLNGYLDAGSISVPFQHLEIGPTSIGFGEMQLDAIGIAGAYTLKFDKNNTLSSFGYDQAAQYGTLYKPAYGCWSLSLLPKDPTSVLTQLTGLPDLAAGDQIGIMNISLYSKGGSSRIELFQNTAKVTLNGMAAFQPIGIENGSDYLKISGGLSFSIPGFTNTQNVTYSLDYTNNGGKLVHNHNGIPNLSLATNGIRVDFDTQKQTFTGNILILNGLLQDKVTNSPYAFRINFQMRDPASAAINTDPDKPGLLSMGNGQQLANINGSMAMANKAWSNFKFAGDLSAMGIDPKNSHLGFEVKGDLVANKASFGVEKMSIPGLDASQFGITYDFDKKALVGNLHLPAIPTPIATVQADIEMLIGGGSWYFIGSAAISKLSIPLPLNGASAAFMVGNSDISDDMWNIVAPVFHSGELPTGIKTNFPRLSGLFVAAGVDLKLPLPNNIDLDVLVTSVHLNYGVYANAYLGMNFSSKGAPEIKTTGGLKIGAYVNIGAGASLLFVCAGISLSADLNAQANVTFAEQIKGFDPMQYWKNCDVDINITPTLTLGGQAYLGYGVCNSDCNSIKVWGVTIPPGCHQTDIGGSTSLSLTMDVHKLAGHTSDATASVSANLFNHVFSGGTTISLPNL